MNRKLSIITRFLFPIVILLIIAPFVFIQLITQYSNASEYVVDSQVSLLTTGATIFGITLIVIILWQLKKLILEPIGADPEVVIDIMHKISKGNFESDGVVAKPDTLLENVVSMRSTLRHSFYQLKDNAKKMSLYASVFNHAHDGIFITSPDFNIIDVNQSFTKITGYTREAVIHQKPKDLGFGFQSVDYFDKVLVDIAATGACRGEVWNLHSDGNVYAAWLDIFVVHNAAGAIENYVGLFSDITEIKVQQKNLEHMAYHDPLTQLPNRTLFSESLKNELNNIDVENELLAICYFDLDGFKPVNDTLGHEAGDKLLVDFSSRMSNCLRETDTIARLGGDEFAMLLSGLPSKEACVKKLDQLLEVIKQPYSIDGEAVNISASIGYTIYPTDLSEADTLIRHADHAMYYVKVNGRGFHHQFDAEKDKLTVDLQKEREALSLALPNDEFVLYYQPQVNLELGTVVGAEALIRWKHPEKGLVSPSEFLPMVEQDDTFTVALGEWVILETLRQISAWEHEGVALRVSVNISAKHMVQDDFTKRLKVLLDKFPNVSPELIEFEITETAVIEDISLVERSIKQCKKFGVSFALDDFGIGYSSLSYLRRLPVDVIKIDQSFIRDMLEDKQDLAVASGVIGLGASFGLQVVAEGVETAEHGVALLKMGCELAQGYGISKPLAANEVLHWAKHYQPDPSWAVEGKVLNII